MTDVENQEERLVLVLNEREYTADIDSFKVAQTTSIPMKVRVIANHMVPIGDKEVNCSPENQPVENSLTTDEDSNHRTWSKPREHGAYLGDFFEQTLAKYPGIFAGDYSISTEEFTPEPIRDWNRNILRSEAPTTVVHVESEEASVELHLDREQAALFLYDHLVWEQNKKEE